MSKLLSGLDHPVLFVVFMTAAVAGTLNLVKWGADAAGLFGLKAALPN
jgi:hypothetical protein